VYPRFPIFWFLLLVLFPPAFFVFGLYFILIYLFLTPTFPIVDETPPRRQTRAIPQSRAEMRV
jgi:hypothetical protein